MHLTLRMYFCYEFWMDANYFLNLQMVTSKDPIHMEVKLVPLSLAKMVWHVLI